ncbi:DUF563 domain-containing protein [Sulfitobacter sp. S190]|uniref:glycosyltransferase family 61 protein n=1 Tax=Sulfitobacter sp. S190 TaxID=2867022 RepID=UPI0021A50780|nr:glycosyltransferase family 61 protein [Sulfitobacter sp. S190]UWR22481.1 glycosyltransferase family 61 protein [Sulfitobacter sp. S190]
MTNKTDLTLPPEDLFFDPWSDAGMSLLRAPEYLWRPITGGIIEGFAVSEHDTVNAKIRSHVAAAGRNRTFTTPVEYASVPVVLDQADYRKSYVMAGGKYLLQGATATRVINSFRWDSLRGSDDAIARLEVFFAQRRNTRLPTDLPKSLALEPELNVAFECRNTFNYFHFITEALARLCLLDDIAFTGDIYFHYPHPDDKHRAFCAAFVDALFPEYAGRVFFERVPKTYAKVLSGFDLVGSHLFAPPEETAPLAALLPRARAEMTDVFSLAFHQILERNAVNSSLIALRKRALAAIEGQDFSHLPTRFFVGRDDRQSRARHMAGEDLLIEHLQLFGFDYVVFENLSPLEQIALMAQAEMMVSYHGAAFTNMLFANPQATVIELGTLQTAQWRWADFWPLANAARCRYVTFFADFQQDDPLKEPAFGQDGIVPTSLSESGTAQVMAFIVSLFGFPPDMPSAGSVLKLGQRLFKVGAPDRALALLEVHDAMLEGHAGLCLLKADCHKALDEPKSELVALDLAFKAKPDRWQTLIRLIWCANRCERTQVIRWALTRLERDFPERHAAFTAKHAWLRYVV